MTDPFDGLLRELAAAPDRPVRDPWLGSTVGAYRIDARLGAGGMGRVYRATDERLHREVALKLLPPTAGGMAFEEARALAAAPHPHIPEVHDVGEIDGHPYLVMALVDGPTLGAIARELTPSRALGVLRDVVDALAHLHAHGIVHRDVKPENIVVHPDGRAILIDLGLASVSGSEGRRAGTPGFVSPEARRGEPPSPRDDVWALGALAAWLATRRVDGVPRQRALRRLAERCRAEDRPADATEVRRDLLAARSSAWRRVAALLIAGAACALAWVGWRGLHGAGVEGGGAGPPVASDRGVETDPVGRAVSPALRWRALTQNGAATAVVDLAVSPSGEEVAFVEPRGLLIARVDGSATRAVPLAPGQTADCVAWFPDGSLLLSGRALVRVTGGVARPFAALEGCARVSPDGASVAVSQPDAVVVVDAGGEVTHRVGGPALLRGLAWSPNSRSFAQIRLPDSEVANSVLEVVDLDEATARPLVRDARLTSEVGEVAVAWPTPDRLWVVLSGDTRPPRTIYATPIDRWDPRAVMPQDRLLSRLSVAGGARAGLRLRERAEVRVGRIVDGRLQPAVAIGGASVSERGSQWADDGSGVWVTRSLDEGYRAVLQPLSGLPAVIPGTASRSWPQPHEDAVLVWELPGRSPGRASLVRIDPGSGGATPLWRTPTSASVGTAGRPDPKRWAFECRADRCVIAGREAGPLRLRGIEPRTGEVQWTRDVDEIARPGVDFAVGRASDRVALSDLERGEVVVVDLAGTGHAADAQESMEGSGPRRLPLPDRCTPQYVDFGADDALLWVSAYCDELPTYRLWSVPVDGSAPRQQLTSVREWLSHPIVSPDGRSLAFTASSYEANVWALEGSPPEP